MGSGFIPSGMYGRVLADFAGVLSECPAFQTFVDVDDAVEALAAQYFFDIDEREGDALILPFARWEWGHDFKRRALGGAGCGFRTQGSVVLWLLANTPTSMVDSTGAAKNWILNQAQGILLEMEALFQQGGRPVIEGHTLVELPFRERESGKADFVGLAVAFQLRN